MAGQDTIHQRIALDGGDEIKQQLQDIGTAGQQAFDALKNASADAAKAGAAAPDALNKTKTAFDSVSQAASGFGSALNSLGNALDAGIKGFGHLATATELAVGSLAAGLLAFSKSSVAVVQDAHEQAQVLGITVAAYNKLTFALGQSGVSQQQTRTAFANLNKEITAFVTQGAAGSDSLSKLGISISKIGGQTDTVDVLKQIADKFQILPDGAEKSALAIQLFGQRAGPLLIPLLNKGADGIEALGLQAQRLGIVFSETEVKTSQTFTTTFARLEGTLSATLTRIGLSFAPLLSRAGDSLTNFIVVNTPAILKATTSIAEAITKLVDKVIVPAFERFSKATDVVAEGINKVFGTKITGSNVTFILAAAEGVRIFVKLASVVGALIPGLGAVLSVFSPLVTVFSSLGGVVARLVITIAPFLAGLATMPVLITLAVIAIGILIGILAKMAVQFLEAWGPGLWDKIKSFGAEAIQAITDLFNGLIGVAVAVWAAITDGAATAFATLATIVKTVTDSIVSLFKGAIDAVTSFFTDLASTVSSIFNTVIDALAAIIQKAVDAAKAVASVLSGGGGASDTSAPGLARGGQVRGPGTRTSDSIMAFLSDQEFVVRADAVRKFGVGFFEALNRGIKPPGFALGGLVDSFTRAVSFPAPQYFAHGGLASAGASTGVSGRPINLTIGEQTFKLVAPHEVAGKLISFATEQQTRRAGKRPGWMGSK